MPKTIRTPLFWDLHLHGVRGVDFMHASLDAMAFACEELGKLGTGFFAPTLLTAEPKLLEEACSRWGVFLEGLDSGRIRLSRGAAVPVGLHLEGPFLNPKMAGAHPSTALAKPSVSAFERLSQKARGKIRIVTLAPELPGAPALIRSLRRRGVRVQLGHSLATSAQALSGVKAGATGITHLYNAMRVHHRDLGLLKPLALGQVTAELITDGVHLDPALVLWAWKATPNAVYAVSDGCCAIKAPANAQLTLGSLRLEKRGAVAVVAKSSTLAGGATPLTAHPARLHNALGSFDPRALSLFFKLQRSFFPETNKHALMCHNHFEAKTLRFLGRD